LGYVNVDKHNSDVELRLLPLQWALDSAIISLQTGKFYATPQELPYTEETNAQQTKQIRLDYLNGIRNLFVLVL
jgi:ATP-binding cassette subfamily A (ABC1) protein 3